jgi:hypothetical protein
MVTGAEVQGTAAGEVPDGGAQCGKREGEPVGQRSISSLEVGGVRDVVSCNGTDSSGWPHGDRTALWGSTKHGSRVRAA